MKKELEKSKQEMLSKFESMKKGKLESSMQELSRIKSIDKSIDHNKRGKNKLGKSFNSQDYSINYKFFKKIYFKIEIV
jgi:hypothetical protein